MGRDIGRRREKLSTKKFEATEYRGTEVKGKLKE
jgi:hypothetical protein